MCNCIFNLNDVTATDVTQTRTSTVSRTGLNRTLPRTKQKRSEVNLPQSCVAAEAGLALYPYVNHVRRCDLETLMSNGKLHMG